MFHCLSTKTYIILVDAEKADLPRVQTELYEFEENCKMAFKTDCNKICGNQGFIHTPPGGGVIPPPPTFVTYPPAMKISTPCHILNISPCAAKHPSTLTFLYYTLAEMIHLGISRIQQQQLNIDIFSKKGRSSETSP